MLTFLPLKCSKMQKKNKPRVRDRLTNQPTEQPIDRQTDRQTDMETNRVACTRLKTYPLYPIYPQVIGCENAPLSIFPLSYRFLPFNFLFSSSFSSLFSSQLFFRVSSFFPHLFRPLHFPNDVSS